MSQLDETPEERQRRYIEAARRGEDIGPDRRFMAALERGDHLDHFLQDIDDAHSSESPPLGCAGEAELSRSAPDEPQPPSTSSTEEVGR